MFNFKKIKETVKKVTSVVLTATLSIGVFSTTPIKATKFGEEILKKIVLVGNVESGKTQIITRMVNNEFKEEYKDTIGADLLIKQYNFNDNQYNFRIWDTPGNEQIESLCTAFIKYGNDVIILTVAYDDSDWKNSINNRLEYVNEIVYEENPVKVVITKSDIDEDERRFKKEDVEEYLSNISEETYQNLEINNTVIETSAKNDTGINHKDGEERNLETCLEDYLLNLFDKQKTEYEEEYEEEEDKKEEDKKEEDKKEEHKEEEHNDKDNTKQNRENKTWKTFKRVGIPGLIVLAVVTSIVAFKDKIKSLFSNKKTVETPACKVKNSAI